MQIALDGPEVVHNKRRGRVATIVNNIELLLDAGLNVSVRTNVDMSNVYAVKELASFYVNRGWPKRDNFSAYCDAVFGCFFKDRQLSKVDVWKMLLRARRVSRSGIH